MKVIRVDPIRFSPEELRPAAEAIRAGGIVAFPTETVYGLGADAFNGEAALKVFRAKRRPPDNPLIVHIRDMQGLYEVAEPPDGFERIAGLVWPGPITFVLRRKKGVPDEVTAGLDTVAVRMPAHPVALELIRLSGTPIAAPSANLSGRPSPTTAEHVIADLGDAVDVVIDSGRTFFGVESTIVDLSSGSPRLLRPGPFTVEELLAMFKSVDVPLEAHGVREFRVAIAPGMKYRHYAPSKPLIIVGYDIAEAAKDAVRLGRPFVLCMAEDAERVRATGAEAFPLGSSQNLYEVARNLFYSLRALDESDADFGIAQPVPEKGIGLAIMNRLRKAAGGRVAGSAEELRELLRP